MAGFGVDRGSGSSSGTPETLISETLVDAKGDLIAATADNTVARLAVGANETRLVAASAETTGLKYVADTVNYAIAAKGDILPGTAADTVAPLTVGANETRLVADSTQATGLKYVADTTNYAVAAKGDLLVGTAADTVAPLTVGANGTIPMARSVATTGLAYVAALNKAIYGLTYNNNGADATNDLDILGGGAMDAGGTYWMTLAATLTKQSDVAWAVGSAAGGLDTGAVGNSDYYIWLIARSDTGVVDALFSLSSTAPTMPTNYDFKRLIGWFKRVGGTIVAFTTYETEGGGLEMNWNVPTLDVNLANTLTTTRRTDAVKVPLNFSVEAFLSINVRDATGDALSLVYCPDQSDITPGETTGADCYQPPAASMALQQYHKRVRTSATGTVAARTTIATMDNYRVITFGFKWARRN